MSEKLKPCPGCETNTITNDGAEVWCYNEGCEWDEVRVPLGAWNARATSAGAAELVEALEELKSKLTKSEKMADDLAERLKRHRFGHSYSKGHDVDCQECAEIKLDKKVLTPAPPSNREAAVKEWLSVMEHVTEIHTKMGYQSKVGKAFDALKALSSKPPLKPEEGKG